MIPGFYQTPQDVSPLSELDGVAPESAKMEAFGKDEIDLSDSEGLPHETVKASVGSPQKSALSFKPHQQEPVTPLED